MANRQHVSEYRILAQESLRTLEQLQTGALGAGQAFLRAGGDADELKEKMSTMATPAEALATAQQNLAESIDFGRGYEELNGSIEGLLSTMVEYGKTNEDQVAALGELADQAERSGVPMAEIVKASEALISEGGSAADVTRDLGLAMQAASVAGLKFEDAGAGIGAMLRGDVSILREFGPEMEAAADRIEQIQDPSLRAAEAQRVLQEHLRNSGSASQRFRNRIAQLKARLGPLADSAATVATGLGAVLGVLGAGAAAGAGTLIGAMSVYVEHNKKLSNQFEDLQKDAGNIAAQFGKIAFEAINGQKAMEVLGGGIERLSKYIDDNREEIGGAIQETIKDVLSLAAMGMGALKPVVAAVIDAISNLKATFDAVFGPIGRALEAYVAQYDKLRSSPTFKVWNEKFGGAGDQWFDSISGMAKVFNAGRGAQFDFSASRKSDKVFDEMIQLIMDLKTAVGDGKVTGWNAKRDGIKEEGEEKDPLQWWERNMTVDQEIEMLDEWQNKRLEAWRKQLPLELARRGLQDNIGDRIEFAEQLKTELVASFSDAVKDFGASTGSTLAGGSYSRSDVAAARARRDGLAKTYEGLKALGFADAELEQQLQAIDTSLTSAGARIEQFDGLMVGLANGGIAAATDAMAGFVAQMAAGEVKIGDIGRGLLSALGGLFRQTGQGMILMGASISSIASGVPNPAALIGYGAGLTVIGAGMEGFASRSSAGRGAGADTASAVAAGFANSTDRLLDQRRSLDGATFYLQVPGFKDLATRVVQKGFDSRALELP